MFGYALKSILRTPVKTILFIVLVSAVTAFSCLGFGMWNASEELIRNADKTYTTSALIEYIDEGYPNSTDYSEEMLRTLRDFDYSLLSDQEEVLTFDRQYDIGGHVEGFPMARSYTMLFPTEAVMVFRYMYTTSRGDIFVVSKVLYSGAYEVRQGLQLSVSFDASLTDRKPETYEEGHYYAAHGRFITNQDGTQKFVVTGAFNESAPKEALSVLEFPFVDLGEDKNSERYRDNLQILAAQARFYELSNTHITVHPTTDASLATPFLQQETHILEGGRFFTEEEYASGSRVIILSSRLASAMDVGVGGTIRLDLYNSFCLTDDGLSGTSDFWPSEEQYLDSGEYTVVGVFQNTENLLQTVYIPFSEENTSWKDAVHAGYQMATVRLKNGTAESYYAKVAPYLEGSIRFTIYDQGYSEAIAPVLAMRETAVLLSAVSAVSALVILLLFAYVFVSRQRGTAHTMLALGTGRAKTVLYLVLCVLFIALVAAGIGVTAGYFLSENVSRFSYEQALQNTNVDHRFSAVYSMNEIHELKTDFTPDLRPLLLVGAGVITVALIYALIHCFGILHRESAGRARRLEEKKARKALLADKNTAKKDQEAERQARRSSRISSTSPALVSLLRGGLRNLIVPLVSLVLLVFIGIFSGEIIDSEYKIEDLYEHSKVMGYFTTMNGWQIDGLMIERRDIEPVAESDFVSKIYPTCAGKIFSLDHEGASGSLILTESISESPEFFFTEEPLITWAEGYDESCLLGNEPVCVISTELASKKGLSIGDDLNIVVFFSWNFKDIREEWDVKIVGVYNRTGSKENIYMPLSASEFTYVEEGMGFIFNGVFIPGQSTEEDVVLRYDSIVFSLRDLQHISELKQELTEKGYTTIGKYDRARKFIVIEDTLLNASVTSLERHAAYMRILFGVTYFLSVVIGFVISYLMTKNRRKELAMMRSMGAGRVRTFLAFFLEQAGLALLGGLLGILVIIIALQGIYTLQLYYFLGYFACYFLGVALSVLIMNRVNVMRILTAED